MNLNQSIIVPGYGEVFSGGPWNPLSLGSKLLAWFNPNANVYSAPEVPCGINLKWQRWVSVNDSAFYCEQANVDKQLWMQESPNGRRSMLGAASSASFSPNVDLAFPYGVAMQVSVNQGRTLSGVANNWLCGSYLVGKHAFFAGEFVANINSPIGWFVSVSQCDGVNSSLLQNGVEVATHQPANPTLPGGLTIGDGVWDRGEDFTSRVGHVVFLKEKLTAAELAILDAFLANELPNN